MCAHTEEPSVFLVCSTGAQIMIQKGKDHGKIPEKPVEQTVSQETGCSQTLP